MVKINRGKFSLVHEDADLFHRSEWDDEDGPSTWYVVYRVILALFMATGVTLNSMGVLWTYFYSMRTTDVELKDYSGIYWIFRTWSGLFVFVCLGLASKPFKAALLGQVKNNANLASILSNLTDPVRSRKDDSDFEDIDDEVSSDSDISSDSLDEEGD